MPFKKTIATDQGQLARKQLSSVQYDPASDQGWIIYQNGQATFNSLEAVNDLTVGSNVYGTGYSVGQHIDRDTRRPWGIGRLSAPVDVQSTSFGELADLTYSFAISDIYRISNSAPTGQVVVVEQNAKFDITHVGTGGVTLIISAMAYNGALVQTLQPDMLNYKFANGERISVSGTWKYELKRVGLPNSNPPSNSWSVGIVARTTGTGDIYRIAAQHTTNIVDVIRVQ